MNLNELSQVFPVNVIRNRTFLNLGAIEDDFESMLVRIEKEKYVLSLKKRANITCVITTPDIIDKIPEDLGIIVTDTPAITFFQIHNHLTKNNFYKKPFSNSISNKAIIHPSVIIGEHSIKIGDNVVIGPNVVINEGTVIDNNVIIRAGSIIASEGFYFKRIKNGIMPVLHAGWSTIGEGVEIQANSVICKGIFGGDTIIGTETKIDNLVHIAHSVTIGERCLIAANVVISGCVHIGSDVWVGPGSTLSNSIKIGDGAQVSLGSVVVKNVKKGEHVTGNFSIEHNKFIKNWGRSNIKKR